MRIYCESHESVVEIKERQSEITVCQVIECVGESSLRVFTKVDETSLTKLNSALHLRVLNQDKPLLTFRIFFFFLRDAEGKRRDIFCCDVLKTIYRRRSGS